MNTCVNCGTETLNPKFCSTSCSAKFRNKNNHWRDKRGLRKQDHPCKNCGTEISYKNKYCSIKCQQEFQRNERVSNWDTITTRSAKKWLIETTGNICSECGISEWNGKPIVLELEHKDGNSENNSKENLCLLCPNCHSQTSTFKAKNKGNGRHYRRIRYAAGKSF